MGTNYYAKNTGLRAEDDHRGPENNKPGLHIGKSSAGWCFPLCIYPPHINSLDDWRKLWEKEEVVIVDEYGDEVGAERMIELITDRSFHTPPSDETMRTNYARRGPRNLLRHTNGTHDSPFLPPEDPGQTYDLTIFPYFS